MIVVVVVVTIYSISGVFTSESCLAPTRCSCTFGAEGDLSITGSGQDEKCLWIAGVAGALGSMVLAGGIFAVWRFVKNKKTMSNPDHKGRIRPSTNVTGHQGTADKTEDSPTNKDKQTSDESGQRVNISKMKTESRYVNVYRMSELW